MEIKVVCVCGQKYKFDVEPVNGGMPWAVKCPVCNADGTASANVLIAQQLAAAPPRPAAPFAALPRPVAVAAPAPVAIAAPAPIAMAAPPPMAAAAPPPVAIAQPAQRTNVVKEATAFVKAVTDEDSDSDTWKWWYYIVAGIGIGAYEIWRAYDTQRIKPLGSLFLSALLICIGVWSRTRKKKAS